MKHHLWYGRVSSSCGRSATISHVQQPQVGGPQRAPHPAISAKHWHDALSKHPEPEILDPEPEYNNPEITPQDFLLAVMRNRKLPMAARIDAATKVAVYVHARLAQVTQDITAGVTIRIEGGLPELPGTNIIMPNTGNGSATTGSSISAKGNGHDPDASS